MNGPSNKELWEEFLPHREYVFVEKIGQLLLFFVVTNKDIELFRHHFVTWEWENGLQKIRVQDLSDGGTIQWSSFLAYKFIEYHYVQLGEPTVYAVWPGEFREDGIAIF